VKTAASDEPTVHWREPSDYPVVKFEQDRDAPRRSLKHRMNRRVSSGSSDGCVKANRDGLATRSSGPDEPMLRRCSCVRESQRLSDVGGASDEPTP
jgi:hypothetical protein